MMHSRAFKPAFILLIALVLLPQLAAAWLPGGYGWKYGQAITLDGSMAIDGWSI